MSFVISTKWTYTIHYSNQKLFGMVPFVGHEKEMSFNKNSRNYFMAFYLLGISPYRPLFESKYIAYCKYSKHIQTIFGFILILISYYLLNFNGKLPRYTSTEILIINLFLSCDLLRSIAAFLQCFVHNHLLNEIVAILQGIDQYFGQYLHHSIVYHDLHRRFCVKVLLIVGVCAIFIAGYIARVFIGDMYTSVNFCLKFLQFMTAITYLFVIFLIDYLAFSIEQLNVVIGKDILRFAAAGTTDERASKLLKERLKCFKFIHFQIYTVSYRMNEYFGYGLLAILLHAISDIVYSVFWLYQTFATGGNQLWSIWSKYT